MKKNIRIFSCIIIAISFLLLFFNWVELTPDAKNAAVDLYNSSVSSEQQVKNFSQLRHEIKKIDFDEALGLDGQSIIGDLSVNALYKSSGIKHALDSVMDGGLNTTEIANVSVTGGKFYRYIESFTSLFKNNTDALTVGKSAALSVFGVIVTIVIIISILAAIFAFVVRLFDKYEKYRKYDLAFFIAQLVLFILSVIFTGSANSLFGVFSIFSITAWGIIAVILACPSIILEKLPAGKIEEYTGRGTVANETFNKVSDSFSEAMGRISDKFGETQNNVRLGQEIKSNEESLNARYQELGKKYYEENRLDPPEAHKDDFDNIKDNRDQIDVLQKDLDTARNVVACPSCGMRWNSGIAYCSSCGTKLPEIEQTEKRYRRDRIQNEFCKHCGAKIEANDAFCPACGESIGE